MRHAGDDLQDIPMLNDLTIFIKPEDINPGIFLISGPYLMAVEDDMVALCKCTLECNFLARMTR